MERYFTVRWGFFGKFSDWQQPDKGRWHGSMQPTDSNREPVRIQIDTISGDFSLNLPNAPYKGQLVANVRRIIWAALSLGYHKIEQAPLVKANSVGASVKYLKESEINYDLVVLLAKIQSDLAFSKPLTDLTAEEVGFVKWWLNSHQFDQRDLNPGQNIRIEEILVESPAVPTSP